MYKLDTTVTLDKLFLTKYLFLVFALKKRPVNLSHVYLFPSSLHIASRFF